MAGSPDVSGLTHNFTDVPETEYFHDPVLWGVNTGIVHGVSDTEFAPARPLNREEVALFLYRTAGEPLYMEDHLEAFPDRENVHDYAVDAFNWVLENGIMLGDKPAGVVILNPAGQATRAQVATLIYRFQNTELPQ